MRTLTRYYLFQVPGWALTAVLVAVLHAWLGLPVWVALTVLGVVVLKDVIFYPFLRRAYQLEASAPPASWACAASRGMPSIPTGTFTSTASCGARTQKPARPRSRRGADIRVVQGQRMTLTVARD